MLEKLENHNTSSCKQLNKVYLKICIQVLKTEQQCTKPKKQLAFVIDIDKCCLSPDISDIVK